MKGIKAPTAEDENPRIRPQLLNSFRNDLGQETVRQLLPNSSINHHKLNIIIPAEIARSTVQTHRLTCLGIQRRRIHKCLQRCRQRHHRHRQYLPRLLRQHGLGDLPTIHKPQNRRRSQTAPPAHELLVRYHLGRRCWGALMAQEQRGCRSLRGKS